jgi:hypothetical protein
MKLKRNKLKKKCKKDPNQPKLICQTHDPGHKTMITL